MSKKDEKIIGVKVSALPPEVLCDGEVIISSTYAEMINREAIVVLNRDKGEKDPDTRHFATYCIVQNMKGDILTYRRPAKNTEDRLSGKLSIGFGGHVNIVESSMDDPTGITKTIFKELHEELFAESPNTTDRLSKAIESGSATFFVFDNTDEVGKQHIAVVKRIVLQDDLINLIKNVDEVIDRKFVPYFDIQEARQNEKNATFENWSNILLDNFMSLPGHGVPAACLYGESPYLDNVDITIG